jgi:hypothetical protein
VVSPSTPAPDAAWVAERARDFAAAAREVVGRAKVLIRDSDSKFGVGGAAFDGALRAVGIEPQRLPHSSPNLNAYAERFQQSLQTECLDKFIILGTKHMDHLAAEYVQHCLHERPHMGLDSRTPAGPPIKTCGDPPAPSDVVCKQRLCGSRARYASVVGGLHHRYLRAACEVWAGRRGLWHGQPSVLQVVVVPTCPRLRARAQQLALPHPLRVPVAEEDLGPAAVPVAGVGVELGRADRRVPPPVGKRVGDGDHVVGTDNLGLLDLV